MREERDDYEQSNHKNDKNLDNIIIIMQCINDTYYEINIYRLLYFYISIRISPDAYERTSAQGSNTVRLQNVQMTLAVSPISHRVESCASSIQTGISWRDVRVRLTRSSINAVIEIFYIQDIQAPTIKFIYFFTFITCTI